MFGQILPHGSSERNQRIERLSRASVDALDEACELRMAGLGNLALLSELRSDEYRSEAVRLRRESTR